MTPPRTLGPLAAIILTLVPCTATLAQGVKPQPHDTDWIAPAPDKAKKSPVPVSSEGIERGRKLYASQCETCHGEKGKGDGPLARLHAQRTARPPYDLTLPEVQSLLTDGEIFWKISVGYRTGDKVIMPAFASLIPAEADRWRIVQFVRTLGPAK
jgi:mono/diheme cytochrome c family protein